MDEAAQARVDLGRFTLWQRRYCSSFPEEGNKRDSAPTAIIGPRAFNPLAAFGSHRALAIVSCELSDDIVIYPAGRNPQLHNPFCKMAGLAQARGSDNLTIANGRELVGES
jgi:hypothetical protein